jgi:hypothetical protein
MIISDIRSGLTYILARLSMSFIRYSLLLIVPAFLHKQLPDQEACYYIRDI